MIQRFNFDYFNKVKFGEWQIELGCGSQNEWRKTEGEMARIDVIDFKQDIVCDLNEGIPLSDNSCKYIYASHTIEHIKNYIELINDCHRVLRKDGILKIIVPHFTNKRAIVPTHLNYFSDYSFHYFTNKKNTRYGVKMWELIELITNERPDIHLKMKPIKC